VHSHFIKNPPINPEATNPSFLKWFCHSNLYGHDRSVLLSIVTQVLLLLSLFCASDDLPPFGDANKGCQWNV
jgi:hypothetical protein